MKIGAVFTSEKWASWLVERSGITEDWLHGARVMDPTCGEGIFIKVIIEDAIKKGVPKNKLPLERLIGIERDQATLDNAKAKIDHILRDTALRPKLLSNDVLLDDLAIQVDRVIGNPPWVNYVDLPSEYQCDIRDLYLKYGLVTNKGSVLLGGSRVDLSALIVAKLMADIVVAGGRVDLFLPLSIFLNEGAHDNFRMFNSRGAVYALQYIYDFSGTDAFPQSATRFGVASFVRDDPQQYPIPYFERNGEDWVRLWAHGDSTNGSALLVNEHASFEARIANKPSLELEFDAKPRQGANTGGANGCYIFDEYSEQNSKLVEVRGNTGNAVRLPSDCVYPLVDRINFFEDQPQPKRWILIPHDPSTGRPFTPEQISTRPELNEYLKSVEATLRQRKGTLIGSWIDKGYWWALLGVGPYAFSCQKIIWRALGAKRFEPKLFEATNGRAWQGNQALHGLISCPSSAAAIKLIHQLSTASVTTFLESSRMIGTKSWLQPGKISRLITASLQVQ